MRILSVDFMGCLYWYHHAKDPDPAWNFIKRLREIIERFKVDKTLLLLEGGSDYRLALHPGYKSDRKKRRESQTEAEKNAHAAFMKQADHLAKNLAPLFGMIPVKVRGAEADDLAAYICKHADPMHQILNLSGDQDWYQLLRKNVCQASFSDIQRCLGSIPSEVWLTGKKFEQRYQIPVDQWIWKKCLAGDTGDSVSGFDQLGEGTALKLLQKYGSISGIRDNLADLEVERMRKAAKDAMLADFGRVEFNYKVMNLCHSEEVEREIFKGEGIRYLCALLDSLSTPNAVDTTTLTELACEKGWLEVDSDWLAPFTAIRSE